MTLSSRISKDNERTFYQSISVHRYFYTIMLYSLPFTGIASIVLVTGLDELEEDPVSLALATLGAVLGVVGILYFAKSRLARVRRTLAGNEARLGAILGALPDCVKTVDAQCRLLDMNPAGLRLIEVADLESIRGRSTLAMIDPAQHEAYRAGVAAVFRGESVIQEFDIITARGHRRRLEQRAVPLFDNDDPGRVREMLAVTRDITAQAATEAVLKATAANLDRAQRIGNIGSWVWSISDNALEWSDHIFRIFGYEPGEIEPSYPAFLERVHPEDRPAVEEAVGHAVATGGRYSIRHRITLPDGGVRVVQEKGEVAFDAEGRASRMHGTVRDVTEQAAIENALRATAENLDQAQRIGDMGSWTADVVANRVHWSDHIYRIFGYEPGGIEPSFAAFLERVHPDDRAMVEEASRLAQQGLRPYDIQHRIVRPDGAVRTVHERAEVEFDASGRPLRMAGTVQDITALRETEERLDHSEATLAGILRISPEGIVIADAEGTITLFSAGAELVFGYAAEEVLGRKIECLMPERFRASHPENLRAFAKSGPPSRRMGERSEIVGRHKDGREFPAEASLSRMTTKHGTMFTTIVRDITAQKAAREEMQAARLKAEAANEAKSRFIANMSHELRTPLNAVIGFSSILMDESAFRLRKEKALEYAGDIFNSAQHLLQVINDILEISSIEIGKVRLDERPSKLADIVSSCLRMVALRAQNAGIEIDATDAAAPLKANIDPRLLTQAVVNLLSNALKFTERGGKVVIAIRPDTDRGGAVLSVTDTGIGMTPEDAGRVGEPFVQVDNRLARKFEGSGLGLAIVKQIMKLHQGDMSIESEPGVGTTVSLWLPPSRLEPAALAARRAAS